MHMAVDIVFRQREVHAVARGLIIKAPLESGAEKRELIQKIVDDGLRHSIKPRGIAAIVSEVVVLPTVFRGLDAIVDEVVFDIVADQVVVAQNIEVWIHVVVDVNRGTERVMAHIFQIGLKTRYVRSFFVDQIVEQRHAPVGYAAGTLIHDCHAHISVLQIVICGFKVWHGVDIHTPKARFHNTGITPVILRRDASVARKGIVK